tara:strand:- start:4409 stop:5482 length:1074 start_codon:yes stop_codon:yes gene_type:complete
MKIFSIVGTRPNFIKAFPLMLELQKKCNHKIIHTGQHYDNKLSNIFFDELKIRKPNYLVKIKNKLQTINQIPEMILHINDIILRDRPSAIIIYGDTSSSLAGALVANRSNIPIVHIESGLRSYDKSMPEETNRIIIDNLSKILVCPTKTAVKNLHKENITKNIFLHGDTNLDAINKISSNLKKYNFLLEKFDLKKKKYIFLTIHRDFNSDNKKFLIRLFNSIKNIDHLFFFPIHPRTAKNLKKFKLEIPRNVLLSAPLGFFECIFLQKNSKIIVTDSGGLQKEAFFLKIPCVTLRPSTEWIETLKYKNNILAHKSSRTIENAIKYQLKTNFKNKKDNFFGKGAISKKIATTILKKIL